MRCYYEELGIARDANDADVKTAYRKLALRWHPDKNPDCLEEAKKRFQMIQQAYEVLSDSHERSWYDNYREQILRGKNSDYEENCLDLFQYFTVTCFKGYGDDENSFYAVYREVFENIASEDAEFVADEQHMVNIPGFGNSQSSYEGVVGPFYAYWQAYCTKKTYSWLCPYDVQEIKYRRVLREIDKDMKKIVQKAKKERNEEVRNLVSFIRKRDKRVQAHKLQLEKRAEVNRKKQEQNRLEQISKRLRELTDAQENINITFNDMYEEQLKQLEQEYDSDSNSEEYTSVEVDVESDVLEDTYCIACNKTFKNEKALANHENSRKHQENVEHLKNDLLEDDAAYDGATAIDFIKEFDEFIINENECSEEAKDDSRLSGLKKNKRKKAIKVNLLPSSEDSESGKEFDFAASDNADDFRDSDIWISTTKKNVKKTKNKKQTKKGIESTAPQNDSANEKIQNLLPSINALAPTALQFADNIHSEPIMHTCATCKTRFASKNKLFAHLKITNHVVYLPEAKLVDSVPKKTTKSKPK